MRVTGHSVGPHHSRRAPWGADDDIDPSRQVGPVVLQRVDVGDGAVVADGPAGGVDGLARCLPQSPADRDPAVVAVVIPLLAGGDRDRGKRAVMGQLASELADLVIVTSDNPRSEDPEAIAAEIVAGVAREVEVELDRAKAIGRAVELAQSGDVVLIAGKGAEQGQEFADRTLPFDDREAAKDALRGAAA